MPRLKDFKVQKNDSGELQAIENGDYQAVCISVKGPDEREFNEDCAYLATGRTDGIVFVVADGMGGHRSGYLASEQVVESLQKGYKKTKETPLRWNVIHSIEKAHKKIEKLKMGAGSTVLCAVIEKNHLSFISVGDSVGLQYGGRGAIKYRTIEHSPSGFASESGLVEDQDLIKDNSHFISNVVGISPMRMEVSQKLSLSKNDVILIGSDGLFDNLTDTEISDYLRKGSLEEKAVLLRDQAQEKMKNGGKVDDLTFLLIARV